MDSGVASSTIAPPVLPRRLTGFEGIWVFVGLDMLLFALLFGAFMSGRLNDPATFEASRHQLNLNFGGVNTLILLTSSWFMVLAVQAARRQAAVAPWLLVALAGGLAFGVSKAFEYTAKIRSGYTMLSNDFFMYYYVLTGIHLVHVLAGCAALTVFWLRARTGGYRVGGATAGLEGMGIYWHMVDLLWIMIFPLLYLVR